MPGGFPPYFKLVRFVLKDSAQIGLLFLLFLFLLFTAIQDPHYPIPSDSEAELLASQIRVMCVVPTGPRLMSTPGIHVRETWGRKCAKLIFTAVPNYPNPGTVPIPKTYQSPYFSWHNFKETLKYVWRNHREDAEWFLIASDTTYVIMENLRLFLRSRDPDQAVYMGRRIKLPLEGAPETNPQSSGYVLSKEALRLFVEVALRDIRNCYSGTEGFEDSELARCLLNVGVPAEDTRDELGRHRFLLTNPQTQLSPDPADKNTLVHLSVDPEGNGFNCCSPEAITFFNMSSGDMYALHYLLYQVRPVSLEKSMESIETTQA